MLVGVAIVPLLFALLVYSTRDDFIACVREGSGDGGGRCHTARSAFDLKEIVGLELEQRSSVSADSGVSTMSRLVLVTRTRRVQLESGSSAYVWDSRPESVRDFDDFLRDSRRLRYPRSSVNIKGDIVAGILALLALGMVALGLRRRGMAFLEIDDPTGALRVTRDLTPKGGFKMVRTEHVLDLAPLPYPTLEPSDGPTFLCLRQGETSTKLVEVSESPGTRARLLREVRGFLADPAALEGTGSNEAP